MISCIFEYGKSFHSSDLCAGKVSISLPVYISLVKHKEYLKGDERAALVQEFLICAKEDSPAPSPEEFLRFTYFVIGEAVIATGARPIVWRLLPNDAYADKDIGFNPQETSDGDKEVQEDINGLLLYKRTNPRLPPRARACEHQIKEKSAECSVGCENRCEPSGYNILVTFFTF